LVGAPPPTPGGEGCKSPLFAPAPGGGGEGCKSPLFAPAPGGEGCKSPLFAPAPGGEGCKSPLFAPGGLPGSRTAPRPHIPQPSRISSGRPGQNRPRIVVGAP